MHTARVLAAHMRVTMASELAYRSNFWSYLVASGANVVVALLGLGLVFGHVDSLGGWSADDLVVVVGSYVVIGGIVNGLVHMSMAKFVEDVKTGAFDFRLLKPVDAQLVAMGERPDVWRLLDVPFGAVIICVGLARGGFGDVAGGPAAAVVAGLCMFAVATVIICAFWLVVSCVVFWTIQGESILWALDDLYYHLRWPIGIFPPGLRIALMSVFPAGLAVTVPAEALTGRLTAEMAALTIGIAAALAAAARLLWKLALRRYEGASS